MSSVDSYSNTNDIASSKFFDYPSKSFFSESRNYSKEYELIPHNQRPLIVSPTYSTIFGRSPSTDAVFSEPTFRLSPTSTASSTSRCLTEFEGFEKIGRGGFGEVFKAKNRLDGCYYALKRIKLGEDDMKNSKILREVSALSRLSHPHIVRYHQAWIEEGEHKLCENDNDCDEDDSFDRTAEATENIFDVDEDWAQLQSDDSYTQSELKLTPTISSKNQHLKNGHIMTCEVCFANYRDWEGSFRDWKVLENRLQQLSLCQNCYRKQLHQMGIPDHLIVINDKTPISHYLFIQMEYCENTLRTRMDDKSLWLEKSEGEIWQIFSQVVEAIAYIHSVFCIHRDLKPGNIFLTSDGMVKLGDFGLMTGEVVLQEASNSIKRRYSTASEELYHSPSASLTSSAISNTSNSPTLKGILSSSVPSLSGLSHLILEDKTSDVGTTLYRSPELNLNRYDEKIDIYSLGIVLYELWNPFNTAMERHVQLEDLRNKHQLPKEFAQKFPIQSDLILRLTHKDSQERPMATALLTGLPYQHFSEYNHRQNRQLQNQVSKIVQENVNLKSELNQLKDTVEELKNLVGGLSFERKNQVQEISRLKNQIRFSMDNDNVVHI